ncbi:MAG: hypothetical protein ABI440_03050 [Casimicrobiaceae bacterium]
MYPHCDESCYWFAGTGGSLSVPQMEHWRYAGPPGWTAPLAHTRVAIAQADPQARQLAHFVRVIRAGETPRVDCEDATQTLAVTLSIAAAARAHEMRMNANAA